MNAVSADSSYEDLTTFARSMHLTDLVHDLDFIDAVATSHMSEENADQKYVFLDLLTDKFHDHFGLNASKRKYVTLSVVNGSKRLPQLFDELVGFISHVGCVWLLL